MIKLTFFVNLQHYSLDFVDRIRIMRYSIKKDLNWKRRLAEKKVAPAIIDGNNKMKRIIQDKQLLIRRIFLMCYDMLAVFAASILALLVRFDFHIMSVPPEYLDEVWRTIPYMAVMTLIIFWVLRLYSSLWSYAGALEMMYVEIGRASCRERV